MDGSRRYNDSFCTDSHAILFASFCSGCGGFHPDCFAIFDEHLLSGTMHDDARTTVVCILQVRLHGGLLAPVTAAKTAGATTLLAANGVVAQHIGLIAEGATSINQ